MTRYCRKFVSKVAVEMIKREVHLLVYSFK